jgi:hypothetical protein
MSARRILLGTTALVLFASSALAADNATLITPCAAGCVTVRSIDTTGSGGPMVPVVALGSTTGATIATIAGTPNTTSVLSVQGTTGGTTLPVTAAQATAGNLNATVVGTGTFAVQATGTVTANAGTNLNTSLLALEAGGNLAAIKPGTDRLISSATNIVAGSALATTSFIIGTRYLSAPPTFSNGQEGAFQIDANGRMLVTANATLGAETTKVIGTVRNLGNVGGVLDAVVGATYPANALAVGVLNGSNIGRLVGDETSGLWVNIKAGAGSGGTAIADRAGWTVSSTNFTLTGGEFTSGGATTCPTASACTVAMTATRGLFQDMNTWAETSLGVPTAYGVAPTTGNYIGVNAFVTNATAAIGNNADGVTVTTGGNSPTISYLEGFNGTTWDRLQVDASKFLKVNVSAGLAVPAWGHVAVAAAPPTGATYIGVLGSGATGGHVAAPIGCDSHIFKHITSATDTLAVQGVASQSVYVCAWRARAAGVATWFLENTASANANCSSANTQITGVATEAANTGEIFAPPFWTGLKNTAGNGLCINSTGTGGVDVDIWYAQF